MSGRYPLMPPRHPRTAYQFFMRDCRDMISESRQGMETFSTAAARLWELVENRTHWHRLADRDQLRYRDAIGDAEPEDDLGDVESTDSGNDDELEEDDNDHHPELLPDHFIVERILNHRVNENGRIEYFINWHGFPDAENTWEPEENCDCPLRIQQYRASLLEAGNNHNPHVNDDEHQFHFQNHDNNGEYPFHDEFDEEQSDEDELFEDMDDGHGVDMDDFEDLMDEYQFGVNMNEHPGEDEDDLPPV